MILEAKSVRKSYLQSGKTLDVLKGIDLKINEAEFVAIVGPSGAGKSTLLHILGGLDLPSAGEVFFGDDELYRLKDKARAQIRNQKFGFVFQFYHLLPEFTALENVLLPALIKEDGKNIKSFEEKGKALLEQVGLKDRVLHKPNQLSGGEQQRVAIARALINEPKIIFCDEPTGNLDSQTGKEIISLLSDLNKVNQQTLVIVTHDENMSKLAHRTIYIKDGRLI